jgi:hypothetical protein
MSETLLRLAVVVVLVAAAAAVGLMLRRWQWASHPPIEATELNLPPGLVVFTSVDCTNCKKMLDALRRLDLPVREVTYELEPGMFEAAGVEAVPLTVVIDDQGAVVTQLPGVVSARRVKWAARRAGIGSPT